jgi:hypothetical protein
MLGQLKSFLGARPFTGFHVVLVGGGKLDVTDRWQVAVGLTEIRYLVPRSDRGTTIEVDRITALEPLEELKQ